MTISLAPIRRSVLLAAAALALSAVACVAVPTAAHATGPIPCTLDPEGHGCSTGGPSGGGSADPWVANLFYMDGNSGNVYIYTRTDGTQVTDRDAQALAKNLSFKDCYAMAHSGPYAKSALCVD